MSSFFNLVFGLLGLTVLIFGGRLVLRTLGERFAPRPDCPRSLAEYLQAPRSDCLPPRTDHAAPGLWRYAAPEAICLLANHSRLQGEKRFFPYKKKKGVSLVCF